MQLMSARDGEHQQPHNSMGIQKNNLVNIPIFLQVIVNPNGIKYEFYMKYS